MASLLLLEPDRVLADTYSQALKQAGHQVVWQTDAQAALVDLDTQSIDLVVLELQLASHNGVELLHEMRSYPDWDQIPVLLHTMVGPSHQGLGRAFWPQLGIVDYLYKPQTSLAKLTQTVDRLLTPALA